MSISARDLALRIDIAVMVLRLAALACLLVWIFQISQVAEYWLRYVGFSGGSGLHYVARQFVASLWWFGLFVALWFGALPLARRIVRARDATRCPRCNFDLTDAGDRCPECALRLSMSHGLDRTSDEQLQRRLFLLATVLLRTAGLLLSVTLVLWILFLAFIGWENPIDIIFKNSDGRRAIDTIAITFAYLLWPGTGILLFGKARLLARWIVFGWPRRRADCV